MNSKNTELVKINTPRLIKLMNQFKHNYNNLAKTFFHNLSNEDKLKILNNEFDKDKLLIDIDKQSSTPLSRKAKILHDFPYQFSHSIINFHPNSFEFAHVRHNAYRTISALMLQGASFEEKSLVLALSCKYSNLSKQEKYKICADRLEFLQNLEDTQTQTL